MRSLSATAPLLTVHSAAPGQYVLRVDDASRRDLVREVIKQLGDAQSIVVVTPSDIKVFAVGEDSSTQVIEEGEADGGLPASVDPETQESIDADKDVQQELPIPKARRRPKPQTVAGRDEVCGRCQGKGQVQTMLDGGVPATTSCPVCQGAGIMRRYGARR